jgi:hypothetical protein
MRRGDTPSAGRLPRPPLILRDAERWLKVAAQVAPSAGANRAEGGTGVTRSTRTDRRRTPRGRWDAGHSLEKITDAVGLGRRRRRHTGMPVEAPPWIDLRLATQTGISALRPRTKFALLATKNAAVPGRNSQKGTPWTRQSSQVLRSASGLTEPSSTHSWLIRCRR